MTHKYKTLGQMQIALADTDYILYTVPNDGSVKSVIIAYCSVTAKTNNSKFRLSIVPNGDILGDKNVINFDELIEPGRGRTKLQSTTLQPGDRVYIRANTAANLSLSLFGDEIS